MSVSIKNHPEELNLTGEEFDKWLLTELYVCYREARCGKRGTLDEHKFELNAVENLVILHQAIQERCYKPGRGIAFVVDSPVLREIFAAPFRDRTIHHLLYRAVAGWWETQFIEDSYSCRVGKGVLYGQKRLQEHIRQVTENNRKKAYVIKLDIQGYFMSLDRARLYERVCWGLDQQFDHGKKGGEIYPLLKYLWREIIFDDPTKGVTRKGDVKRWTGLAWNKSLFNQPEGQGIVIGNLSSQLLSNIYLDQLDKFVTEELGYEHYGRYVDDFYIVVSEEEYAQAKRDVAVIEEFLAGLGLVLHPKKRYYQEVHKGVPFLGVRVYPGYMVPDKRIKENFRRAVLKCAWGLIDQESIISYLGHLKHCSSAKVIEKTFEMVGWNYTFCL